MTADHYTKKVHGDVLEAVDRVKGVVPPLVHSQHLSDQHGMEVWLKKEYDSPVGSYKWRGALNALTYHAENGKTEFICASAGNHAQGFALACEQLGVHGTVVMPKNTAERKKRGTKDLGKTYVSIVPEGDTYDEAYRHAVDLQKESGAEFIHAFDDPLVVAGQGTIGHEVYNHFDTLPTHEALDAVILPIGGGGLIAGVGACLKYSNPEIKIIGVESKDAPAMHRALERGKPTRLRSMSTFLEGTAVQRVGDYTFAVAQEVIDEIILVDEGQVCHELLRYHETEGDLIELAAAEGLAALHHLQGLERKSVGVILTGKNANLGGMERVSHEARLWQDVEREYELIFSQRSGFLLETLNTLDTYEELPNITKFHYNEVPGVPFAPVKVAFKVQANGASAQQHWHNLEQALREMKVPFKHM